MAYIGRQNLGGAYRQLDDISSSFNGSTTAFTMQVNSTNVSLGDVNQIVLSLGGVIQKPGTDFTISGSTLTFTTAPVANTSFFAILLGSDNGGTVTPTDGSVTGDKLASTVTTSSNISLDGGTFIFNESGADKDFRIESSSNANALHVDGGNSSVGINTTGPSDASLQINDTVSIIKLLDTDDNTFSRMYHSAGNFLIDVDKGNTGSSSYFQIGIDDEQVMKIDNSGHLINPKNCCASVRKTSTQSNMTNNETITFDTEDIDQGNNFGTSTANTFQAPVDGNYLITVNVAVTGPDGTATYNRVKLITTNRNYSFGIKAKQDYDAAQGDPSYDNYGGSLVTNMDAGDTAYIVWSQAGSSDKADAFDSTFASFTLVC